MQQVPKRLQYIENEHDHITLPQGWQHRPYDADRDHAWRGASLPRKPDLRPQARRAGMDHATGNFTSKPMGSVKR